jgi:hypothetical protein
MTELAEVCERQEKQATPTEVPQSNRSSTIRSRGADFRYLFACRALWRGMCNEEAFWELLCARISADPETRLVARTLLDVC